MNLQGRGGDRAHEATTILAGEAYRAPGNPAMYPEQISEGLRAWQPKKLYFSAPASQTPGARVTRVNTATYDALLGRTYAEIGADAHSNHKCQGTSGLPALPGFATGRGGGGGQYQLVDSTIPGKLQKDETGLFDSIDT